MAPEREHFSDKTFVKQKFFHRREKPQTKKTLIELEKLHSRKKKLLIRWKTRGAKGFQFDEANVSYNLSIFRVLQQLDRQKCTQCIFSTQAIVQFLINQSEK